jgi:hypothetical protein
MAAFGTEIWYAFAASTRNVAQTSAAEWWRRLQEITKRDRCGALQRAVRDRAGSAIEVSQSRASVI